MCQFQITQAAYQCQTGSHKRANVSMTEAHLRGRLKQCLRGLKKKEQSSDRKMIQGENS